ncbi:MAG: hypothetical protein M3416_12775 [Acidobacteriota bacterium]|nr:hypothetical protein [Acidobacteriota bacterium]
MPSRKTAPAKAARKAPRKSGAQGGTAVTAPAPTGEYLTKICQAYEDAVSPLLDEVITCLRGPEVRGENVPANPGCIVLADQLQTLKDALDEAFAKVCPETPA